MGRFFCSIAVVAVAAVGCNALTGASDLELGATCPDCNASASDASATDASATDATATDATPDTATDVKLDAASGADAPACACSVPGATCVDGKCGPPPPSCKALLASAPGTPTGMYVLDPDGAGTNAPFAAPCDMTTLGGGWTLVFVPALLPYNTTTLDYTISSTTLLNAATETLLAYRKGTSAMLIGGTAVFALPAAWKTAAPFKASAKDLTVAVSLDGVPSSNILRYGSASFTSLCDDAWDETSTYGRICIMGSRAPFYNGFAAAGQTDFCADSSQANDTTTCTAMHQFTIGVR